MAISPISSVSFNNYNNVTFAGRKNKEHHNNVSNPVSHKLAVPTAALMLAMMPSNAVSAPEWETENRIEYIQERDIENLDDAATYRIEPQEEKDYKVVQRSTIKNASPTYGDCFMELVSSDGGKTGHIVLNFKDARRYNGFVNENGERKKVPIKKITSYALNLDTLKKVNNHSYDITTGKTNVYPTYHVTGSTKIFTRHVRDNEQKTFVRNDSNERNMDIEVNEETFNSLRSFVGDLIPYKEVDRETDIFD